MNETIKGLYPFPAPRRPPWQGGRERFILSPFPSPALKTVPLFCSGERGLCTEMPELWAVRCSLVRHQGDETRPCTPPKKEPPRARISVLFLRCRAQVPQRVSGRPDGKRRQRRQTNGRHSATSASPLTRQRPIYGGEAPRDPLHPGRHRDRAVPPIALESGRARSRRQPPASTRHNAWLIRAFTLPAHLYRHLQLRRTRRHEHPPAPPQGLRRNVVHPGWEEKRRNFQVGTPLCELANNSHEYFS